MQRICHLSVLRTRYSSLTVSVQPGLSTQAQVERLLASPAVNCLSQAQVTCPPLHPGNSQCKGTGRGGEGRGFTFRCFHFLSKVHTLKAKYAGFKRNIMTFFMTKTFPSSNTASFLSIHIPTHVILLIHSF